MASAEAHVHNTRCVHAVAAMPPRAYDLKQARCTPCGRAAIYNACSDIENIINTTLWL